MFEKIPKEALGAYRDFDPASIMTTAIDPAWTGGIKMGDAQDLSASDKELVARIYPGR